MTRTLTLLSISLAAMLVSACAAEVSPDPALPPVDDAPVGNPGLDDGFQPEGPFPLGDGSTGFPIDLGSPPAPIEPGEPTIPGVPSLPKDPREPVEPGVPLAPFHVAAYVVGSGSARPDASIDSLDLEGIDDLIYAFARHDGERCQLENPAVDEGALAALAGKTPEATTLRISLRLWNDDGSAKLPVDDHAMTELVRSCVSMIKSYGLDGIDLAFPHVAGEASADDADVDIDRFRLFAAMMRHEMAAEYSLTVAIPAGAGARSLIDSDLFPLVDGVHAAAYDFDGATGEIAMPFAPLSRMHREDDVSVDVQSAIEQVRNAGIPAELLSLGISLRGRAYEGVDASEPTDDGLFSYASGLVATSAGDGRISLDDFHSFAGIHYVDSSSGAEWRFDPTGGVLLASETPRTVREKRTYAEATNLRGIVLWDLAADSAEQELLAAVR